MLTVARPATCGRSTVGSLIETGMAVSSSAHPVMPAGILT